MSHDSLDAVIAGYMLAVEAGEVPNRQELLDRHPEHADALRAFFADLDRMDRVASPLRLADGLEATGAVEANGHTAPPTDPLLRRLRAVGGDRPGRDGDRLQGAAGVAQPARRAQDDPRRQLRLQPRRPAVPHRGRVGGEPRPSAHRADLRGRRARGAAILLDEVRRGDLAGGASAGRRPCGGRRPGRRGPRRAPRAPARRVAPRPEALERAGRFPGNAAGHRLRPGEAAGRPAIARSPRPARCWARRSTWPPSRPPGGRT